MEWIGLVCLGLILCYSGYPGRVKTLESKVKKLEKKNAALSRTNSDAKNRSAEGALKMSQIINDLKGKKCNMVLRDSIDSLFDNKLACTVLDTDEEWIKINCVKEDKKKGESSETIRIIRIDDIESIEYSE